MNTFKPQLNVHSSSAKMALIAACGAGVMWGTGALVVNILVAQYGFTPENVSFWRFSIGAVVLVGVFGRGIVWSRLRPLLPTVILSGTAMAGYVLLWFLGIEQMGAAVPTLIALCLPPVVVTIIGVARGQERADLQLLLVLSGAITGTVLIITQHGATSADVDSHSTLLGVVFSIGSALLYANFSMINGRISIALGAGQATACLTVVAAVVMGLTALFRPLNWPTEFPQQAWFLYLGLVTAALALLAFSWGAARLKPTALTVATLLEPLTAVVLSALLLGQHFDSLQWIGSSLLLISIWGLGRRASEKGKN
ncbi:EamA family transporter [Desulfobacter hydrogenophilus]|uniref:DMT family transporter n=1 Tax=Desulfobacter hydrogenophilus TaxID=2291 RepID=A0A328FI73_9BACT|nr:DMT family transporter [Desulfobacter hydrogenophilus]NDY70856.1 DMT family transporter [Desulfobacter hydrogenophilus]QBH11627.1 DMT family transporter [Desulfobacter hydrogenophilus]RAM03172.1 EamA family transporter [Desulfobacter hydrogenophilus]